MEKKMPNKHTAGVSLKILTRDEREKAEEYWRKLETTLSSVPLVCTWDWVATWLDNFGDIVDYWFCVGFRGKNVIGIILLTKEVSRWLPLPVTAFHLGTQGEPLKDWIHMVNNNVLVRDDDRTEFLKVLMSTFMTQYAWEELLINDANPDFAKDIVKALARKNLHVKEVVHDCQIIDLEKIREQKQTILQSLSHDTRYQIKRSLKEFGEIETKYATTVAEGEAILKELIILHQEALTKRGKRGAFSSERFTAFHFAIIKKFISTGRIILFRAKSKRLGTIGCFYLFNDNGTAYGYLAGLNDFSTVDITTINSKRLKPGFVMHALCMEECLRRGINEYNFSVGSEPYKKEFTSESKQLVTVKVQKSLKARVRETMFEAYIRAEEQKQFQLVLKPVYSLYLRFTK